MDYLEAPSGAGRDLSSGGSLEMTGLQQAERPKTLCFVEVAKATRNLPSRWRKGLSRPPANVA
jgi:hypothetical protein